MARVVNYEQKIESIKAKIEKKTEELKALKAQVRRPRPISRFSTSTLSTKALLPKKRACEEISVNKVFYDG